MKKILSLFIAIVMILLLVACTTDNSDGNNPNQNTNQNGTNRQDTAPQIVINEEIDEDIFRFEIYFNAAKTSIDKSSILKKLKKQMI